MKKLVIIIGVLIAGSPFVSCKKMKDDIKDLKSEISDLQKQNDSLNEKNAELQGQANGVESAIGSNEPMVISTTFTDNNGASRSIGGVYKFKSSDYSTQRMIKQIDGTYYIYIERYSSISGDDRARLYFYYNPTTKAITSLQARHYWYDYDPYRDQVRYYSGYTGVTMNLTIESINVTTGDISLKLAASGSTEYANAYPSYVPNTGKPVSTTLSFTGKLKVMTQE